MSQPPSFIAHSRPWQPAVDSLIDARRIVSMLQAHHIPEDAADQESLAMNWVRDEVILKHAAPFWWGKDTISAVQALSQKIPGDAELNFWNLQTNAAWWHFETPLPMVTNLSEVPVKAISLGWFDDQFVVSCWVPDHIKKKFLVCPSQVWTWKSNETLDSMLVRVRKTHEFVYRPSGPWGKEKILGVDKYMVAAEYGSRFILGALMWMSQRLPILTTTEQPIERHRRKEFNKSAATPLSGVKVVQLRRRESQPSESTGHHPDHQFRWIVDGHFRHQPVGPGGRDRKLIWIDPFLKGPADKPLKAPAVKVYQVSR